MRLEIKTETSQYDINIGRGFFREQNLADEIKKVYKNKRIAIISDTNVWELYGEKVKSALSEHFSLSEHLVAAGEESKSLKTLEYLYESLSGINFLRSELIIALGGGVVGDLTGFCAATYLRGVNFIQIPTTLLAAVDSSVGGKTAVNLKSGKNLVGAFYQPSAVIFDPDVLSTLNDREFRGGMAEVIKYAFIYKSPVYDLLKQKNRAELDSCDSCIEDVVYECCKIKKAFVEEDEFDNGNRMILNFGHTFGHAIEKITNYTTYIHGEAVGFGMLLAAEFSRYKEFCANTVVDEVKYFLRKYGLPEDCGLDLSEIVKNMRNDKKNKNEKITLILLREVGEPFVYEAKYSELEEFCSFRKQ